MIRIPRPLLVLLALAGCAPPAMIGVEAGPSASGEAGARRRGAWRW